MDIHTIEWDENKNKINQTKHNIGFEEASTVFNDPNSIEFDDPDHSENEDRFLLIGLSSSVRYLIVCFCERKNGDVIRIITARKLNKQEVKYFKKGDFQ